MGIISMGRLPLECIISMGRLPLKCNINPPMHHFHGQASIGMLSGGPSIEPIIFAEKSKLVGKIHGQIRIQIARVKGVWVFDFAQQEKEGKDRADIPRRPTKNWQGRRHFPVVGAWKEGGRTSAASEREEKRREREAAAAERAFTQCFVSLSFFLVLLLVTWSKL